jgi:hypothetical protein
MLKVMGKCTTPSPKTGIWIKRMLDGRLTTSQSRVTTPARGGSQQGEAAVAHVLRRRSQNGTPHWEKFIRLVVCFFAPITTLHRCHVLKIGPFSMIDWYGAPYTRALHNCRTISAA